MASFSFWQRWLYVIVGFFILYGLYMALLSWSPLYGPFSWMINGAFWQGRAPDAATQQFMLWVNGLLGGAMVWLGIMFFYLVKYPFAGKEKWSSDALILGMSSWFVIDTFLSAYTKAYFNVGFNIVSLALIGLPLAMTRKEFK